MYQLLHNGMTRHAAECLQESLWACEAGDYPEHVTVATVQLAHLAHLVVVHDTLHRKLWTVATCADFALLAASGEWDSAEEEVL